MLEGKNSITRRYGILLASCVAILVLITVVPIIDDNDEFKIYSNGNSIDEESHLMNTKKVLFIASILIYSSTILSFIGLALSSYDKVSIDPVIKARRKRTRILIGGFLITGFNIVNIASWGFIYYYGKNILYKFQQLKFNWSFYLLGILFLINIVLGFLHVINPNYSLNVNELKIIAKKDNMSEKIKKKVVPVKSSFMKGFGIPIRSIITAIFFIVIIFSLVFITTPFIEDTKWLFEDNFWKIMETLFFVVLGFIFYNEVYRKIMSLPHVKRSKANWKKESRALEIFSFPSFIKIQENIGKIIFLSFIGSTIAVCGVCMLCFFSPWFTEKQDWIYWTGGLRTWDRKLYGEILYWLVVLLSHILCYGLPIIFSLIGISLFILPGFIIGRVLKDGINGLVAGLGNVFFLSFYWIMFDMWADRSGVGDASHIENNFWMLGVLLILQLVVGTIGGFIGGRFEQRTNAALKREVRYIPRRENEELVDYHIHLVKKKTFLPTELLEADITYKMVDTIQKLIETTSTINIYWLAKVTGYTETNIELVLERIFNLYIGDKREIKNYVFGRKELGRRSNY